MKTSLDHLPAHKREQIAAIAALVRAAAPVEMVILFGSYARGDWVEDLVNAYFSDFDIMVLVATEALAEDDALWASVSRQARPSGSRVPVSLLVHEIRQFNRELRSGQYFYADILREGVLLHDSRRFSLARPKALLPAERLALGERSFRYWFQSAREFWRGSVYYAGRGLGPHAAFLLHQAAERYFHAALLVFTGYKPKTHDLEDLAKQTAPLHPALAGALPRAEGEDERLFDLLKRAYIEARYSKSYRITEEELEILSERVRDLGVRVRQACVERLSSYCGPEAVGELPPEPPAVELDELPAAPPLDDPEALERWRDAILELSFERGEILRREARREGRLEGQREAQARGIVDVLRRRGVAVSDAEAERILACREEAVLARWWDKALSAASAAELLDELQA
jgi:uncharacterized protein